MKITETELPGMLILEPKAVRDARGFFLESYTERAMAEVGIRERFVQDNHSFSVHNVVRGLHYQVRPQGKLVRAIVGEILDIAVDLRRSSPTFGVWHGVNLSEASNQLLWIPPGLAHGFRVLSEGPTYSKKPLIFMTPEPRALSRGTILCCRLTGNSAPPRFSRSRTTRRVPFARQKFSRKEVSE